MIGAEPYLEALLHIFLFKNYNSTYIPTPFNSKRLIIRQLLILPPTPLPTPYLHLIYTFLMFIGYIAKPNTCINKFSL